MSLLNPHAERGNLLDSLSIGGAIRKSLSRGLSVHARLAALILLTCVGPAFAEDGVGGSLSIVSDYVYRGISYSNEQPAIQGDIHYVGARGFSAGLWASTVHINGW